MLKTKKSNSPAQRSSSAMKRARRNIYAQALLAALMVFLTVVVMFAITAAWYTNVVQTGGLTFEAETWGFKGTVTLQDSGVIKAAPGEEGVIALTAENKSNSIAAVSVNVDKSDMDAEIRKRIYFYVDTQATRGGETVERVYLSNATYYTYTLFGGGTLTLGDTVYNDAQLKWHWVRDVLGYYVRGTMDENENMEIVEYLRPIEYDYDVATTVFDEGNVASIDGMEPSKFLLQLSQSDGYAGEIDTDPINGYYAVDVDEDGYGVWAYLCTLDEINANNQYDTALGEATEKAQYRATITLSAQNSDIEVVEVSTPAGLLDALEEAKTGGKTVVQLGSNVTLTEAVTLSDAEQVMIDLNGHTLTLASGTYANKNAGIQLSAGSSLTVTNGSLQGTDADGIAVYAMGAELTMSDVTVTNAECAVYVRDDKNADGTDSKVRLVGCTFTTSEEGIYLSGNGSASDRKTQLIVEDCKINSGYAGIMGNGSTNQCGTDIQVIASEVQGKYTGIYQPQKDSTLTVSGGSIITGGTGLVLKGGSANIIGSTVSGTGELNKPKELPTSGFTDTGDGIYIETNYGYEITLQISDESEITSENGLAYRIYDDNTNVNVNIISAYIDGELITSDETEENDAAEVNIVEEQESPEEDDPTNIEGDSDIVTTAEPAQSSEPDATTASETSAVETTVVETTASETTVAETTVVETTAS